MPTQGTTTQRGYGNDHQKQRRRYAPLVASGAAECWRCIENGRTPQEARIDPNEPWDLGHDDTDPTRRRYKGPEHVKCNRATKGRNKTQADTSRAW